jgi:hypothetical protein
LFLGDWCPFWRVVVLAEGIGIGLGSAVNQFCCVHEWHEELVACSIMGLVERLAQSGR